MIASDLGGLLDTAAAEFLAAGRSAGDLPIDARLRCLDAAEQLEHAGADPNATPPADALRAGERIRLALELLTGPAQVPAADHVRDAAAAGRHALLLACSENSRTGD